MRQPPSECASHPNALVIRMRKPSKHWGVYRLVSISLRIDQQRAEFRSITINPGRVELFEAVRAQWRWTTGENLWVDGWKEILLLILSVLLTFIDERRLVFSFMLHIYRFRNIYGANMENLIFRHWTLQHGKFSLFPTKAMKCLGQILFFNDLHYQLQYGNEGGTMNHN